MLQCRDIDALMVDWLYEELDALTSAPFEAHVDGCTRCRGELDSLAYTRAAMRDLPQEEPPSSITAILLHEAAKRAPAPARAAAAPLGDDEARRGFFGWLASLLDPIVAHPAAAALATLVLVAGVAGSMYLRGGPQVSTPQVASHAEAPRALEESHQLPAAAAPAPEPTARMPGWAETEERGEADQGYAADLAAEVMDPADAPDDLLGRNAGIPNAGDEAKKKRADLSQTLDLAKEQPARRRAPVATNAVSGADPLIDLEDGDVFEMQVKGELGNAPNADPPPPPIVTTKQLESDKPPVSKSPAGPMQPSVPPAGQPAAGESKPADSPASVKKKDAAAERAWAQSQAKKLEDAARLKRCRDAAQIANDLLDRNPDYYYSKVTGSVAVKSCSGFVEAERKRRARVTRSKAKPKSPAPASGSKDAKAAPQPDEAASE